ncbi:MAG: hypothetical protein ACKVII_22595 [Planctomycetales bacterium]
MILPAVVHRNRVATGRLLIDGRQRGEKSCRRVQELPVEAPCTHAAQQSVRRVPDTKPSDKAADRRRSFSPSRIRNESEVPRCGTCPIHGNGDGISGRRQKSSKHSTGRL